jgi:hypothetical protein
VGLSELFQGTPPQLGIGVTHAQKPPMFNFARDFGDYLRSLIGQNLPSYGGPIDPGMSPTMANAGVMSQAYSKSPLPSIMGQAQGTLSQFMKPSFANPVARMQMGAPNYFQTPPGQEVFGGGPPGNSLTPQMPGMPGPAPSGPPMMGMQGQQVPDLSALLAALRGGA